MISVAVIDTGIDPQQFDARCLLPGINLSTEGPSVATIDYGTHGTAIAQTIIQVAPAVQIVPIKLVDRWGVLRDAEAMTMAFKWILANCDRLNIQVICVALADTSHSQSDARYQQHNLRPLIQALRSLEVVTVAAAGNWYPEHRRRSPQGMAFPAIFREVVSVGALIMTPVGFQLTPNSQRLHPSVGVDCFTSIFVEPGAPGETSGAAAIVAGYLAKLRQSQPELTIDELVDQLDQTGQTVLDENGLAWKAMLNVGKLNRVCDAFP
jgi:hypothetical protein